MLVACWGFQAINMWNTLLTASTVSTDSPSSFSDGATKRPVPDILYCRDCGVVLESTFEGQPVYTHRLS
jgi:hypothetical protein